MISSFSGLIVGGCLPRALRSSVDSPMLVRPRWPHLTPSPGREFETQQRTGTSPQALPRDLACSRMAVLACVCLWSASASRNAHAKRTSPIARQARRADDCVKTPGGRLSRSSACGHARRDSPFKIFATCIGCYRPCSSHICAHIRVRIHADASVKAVLVWLGPEACL